MTCPPFHENWGPPTEEGSPSPSRKTSSKCPKCPKGLLGGCFCSNAPVAGRVDPFPTTSTGIKLQAALMWLLIARGLWKPSDWGTGHTLLRGLRGAELRRIMQAEGPHLVRPLSQTHTEAPRRVTAGRRAYNKAPMPGVSQTHLLPAQHPLCAPLAPSLQSWPLAFAVKYTEVRRDITLPSWHLRRLSPQRQKDSPTVLTIRIQNSEFSARSGARNALSSSVKGKDADSSLAELPTKLK